MYRDIKKRKIEKHTNRRKKIEARRVGIEKMNINIKKKNDAEIYFNNSFGF